MASNTIIRILSDILCISQDEITEKTNLNMEFLLTDDDYSLLLKGLEYEYEVNIDIQELIQLDTVRDIAGYIESLS